MRREEATGIRKIVSVGSLAISERVLWPRRIPAGVKERETGPPTTSGGILCALSKPWEVAVSFLRVRKVRSREGNLSVCSRLASPWQIQNLPFVPPGDPILA